MKQSPRIIIVSELFFPEESATAYIMTCIADHFALDNNVVVITGPESYEGEPKRINESDGITSFFEIVRVNAPKLDKKSISNRILRFAVLSIRLFHAVAIKTKKGDILLSVTNPPPIIILLAILKKLKNFEFNLLVHDVFPENAVATGIIKNRKSIIFKIIIAIFNWAYSSTDKIIVIGRDMADILNEKIKPKGIKKIAIIENWADISLIHPISRKDSHIDQWALENKIVLQYAGNIGRAQGILEIAKALESIQNSLLHFVFTGAGACKADLENQLNKSKIKNISTFGVYGRNMQEVILGSCDIAIVVLGPGMYGLGVPSKTYNIMAAGKPILYIGPKNSEIYCLVIEKKIGWAFDWSELDKVISFLNQITLLDFEDIQKIGARSRYIAEMYFTKSIALAKFKKVIFDVQND
jgi:hypothetical protein